jgi:hypothetical protein
MTNKQTKQLLLRLEKLMKKAGTLQAKRRKLKAKPKVSSAKK